MLLNRFWRCLCVNLNDTKLSATKANKSRPTHSSKVIWLIFLYDISCFLLLVNVLSFIAFNNMEELDIPEESFLAMLIRYCLYIGAIFQMVCLGAVVFMVPRSSSKSITGAIWSFLRVNDLFVLFLFSVERIFTLYIHKYIYTVFFLKKNTLTFILIYIFISKNLTGFNNGIFFVFYFIGWCWRLRFWSSITTRNTKTTIPS